MVLLIDYPFKLFFFPLLFPVFLSTFFIEVQLSSQLFTSWDTYSHTSTCWLPQHLVILWLTSRFKWYLIPPLQNPPSLKKEKSPIKLLLGLKYTGEHCLKVFMGRFKNRDFLSLSFHLYLLLAIFLLKKVLHQLFCFHERKFTKPA